MSYVVYLLTNVESGKRYVGYTSKSLAVRWRWHIYAARYGGRTYICNAIRKYGPEVFSVEEIGNFPSQLEATNAERLWIALLSTHNSRLGYNQTFGGDGGSPSVESRAYRSKWAREHGHGKWMKGRVSWKKGKTNIELYGHERAASLSRKNGHQRRGKTAIEIYGLEKAKELRGLLCRPAPHRRRACIYICYQCFRPFRMIQKSEQVFCSKKCKGRNMKVQEL